MMANRPYNVGPETGARSFVSSLASAIGGPGLGAAVAMATRGLQNDEDNVASLPGFFGTKGLNVAGEGLAKDMAANGFNQATIDAAVDARNSRGAAGLADFGYGVGPGGGFLSGFGGGAGMGGGAVGGEFAGQPEGAGGQGDILLPGQLADPNAAPMAPAAPPPPTGLGHFMGPMYGQVRMPDGVMAQMSPEEMLMLQRSA
jgi:hypothetical protein